MLIRYLLTFLLLLCLVTSPTTPAKSAGNQIAVVFSSDQPRYREAHKAFVRALAAKGFDRDNVEFILQNPNPDPISWANAARKINAVGADVMITYGAPVTLAAVRESVDIPVVFVDVYGPVDTGISRSMTTAGRNITGVSSKVPMATLITALLGIKPVKNIGVIYSSREIGSLVQLKEIKRIAAQHGFSVTDVNVSSSAGLDGALSHLLSQVGCIYVSECSVGCKGFDKIVTAANSRRVPVLSQMPDAAEKGALISLEANSAEQGQLAADYAAKILGGKKPSQMQVLTPKKVELIVNMRAAKSLDLTVPFQVLGQATKILK